ncbi:MAG: hypothetical protein WD886_09105 [Burkholderiales bacterium]
MPPTAQAQAHFLSHRPRTLRGMIPLDLLIALAPAGLLFLIWVLGD